MSALDDCRHVRDLRGLGAIEKSILYALVLRADERRQCWPSYVTLALDAGVSVRSAKTAVRALNRAGHISCVRRAVAGKQEHDSNLYTVKVVQQLHHVVQEVHDVVHAVHEGSAGDARQVVHAVHDGGAPRAQELPNELPNGRERGRAADAATPQPARSRTPRAPNGTRLPADWTPSAAVVAWAKGEGIDHTPAVEAFRDHWLASSLPRAVKRDWDAAFRTWLRRDLDAGKARRLPPTPTPRPQAPALTPEERQQSARIVREAREQLDASIAARAIR